MPQPENVRACIDNCVQSVAAREVWGHAPNFRPSTVVSGAFCNYTCSNYVHRLALAQVRSKQKCVIAIMQRHNSQEFLLSLYLWHLYSP